MSATTQGRLRVAIVGGGISGLSTAWYLAKAAAAHGITLDYTVLEKADHWGGKVRTEHVEDFAETPFVVETGPDSFLTQKPWALQLARDLGLSDQLLGTNDDKRHVYVLRNGKPVIVPDGVFLIVPTKFKPFALSPLISPLGKLRMAFDLVIPPKRDDADETIADFVKRRLGAEAVDRLAEPMLAGIYNAEAEQQSILATFPRFRDLEKNHGSLTRGMLASRRKQARNSSNAAHGKVSAFVSFQGGTQTLIDALVPKLTGDLRLDTGVALIQPESDGTYTLTLEGGDSLTADAVVVAAAAYHTADLVRSLAPEAAAQLDRIRYVSTGTISIAFRTADIPRPLDGFGILMPSSERRPINAVTISSTKFDQRAPDGYVLMRVFFGGSRSPQSMHLDDAALLSMVRDQLRQVFGVEAEPLFHRIYRWWNANPQYDVGHLERVDQIEASLPDGLYVTGS
ncbi:MAG: protoporphyrinogen oxidase, partial [Chloroflexi bacterium]|nr:protoporphyrinogen oxidase [Chloroflexota bacterium]